jgi:hypothetical protein
MKVLFAVSNESISEAIIKRYPKEYRELLSYKNVYYFNAILKEIQNDKSYDRIVISEDLEPFVNTNHDSIDNFIFEHLDKISDEAQDSSGKEISIILICSERRTFGSNILNKLFSIGIYNALIGNDRNMTELCKLINRPRTKKEAKLYYRIDQAMYDPSTDNGEVKEAEIQNILNHFKKLGKNTERYADSFNNIAAQYTDEQLKLIINVLPMKVKAVLEEESEKYQSLMGTSGTSNRRDDSKNLEPGIKVNTIGKGASINGPIVIPSGVKRFNSRVESNVNPVVKSSQPTVKTRPVVEQAKPVQEIQKNNVVKVERQAVPQVQQSVKQVATKPEEQAQKNSQVKNDVVKAGQRYTGSISQVKRILRPKMPTSSNIQQLVTEETEENDDLTSLLNGISPDSTVNNEIDNVQEKRGRGRPKKPVTEEMQKPKGKRGRPKKVIDSDENDGLNELLNPVGNSNLDDTVLPGLDDEVEENLNNSDSVSETLPGLEDIQEDEVLPGLEENDEGEGEEVDVSSLLASLDDDDNSAEILPGLEDNKDDVLPGLETSLDDDNILPGLENDESDMLPGLDNNDYDDTLPGLDNIQENDDAIPGLDDDENETILPGMGFEDTDEEEPIVQDFSRPKTVTKSDAIESIKPKINYSMSNLNSLLSKDKKIVTFLGTTKNGTSFLVNNLALMFSLMGINTAILDMTQNRNSYYIFTDSREELRNIAYTSISKLESGYSEGIKFNKNLTVYTALPADGTVYENAEPILSTLVQNHSLVLIDCDFTTPPAYFASCQEIYLVQSMDILTIQPLTAFIRDLKFKGAWEPEKARVVINKETSVKVLNNKMIIGGMSRYNGPDMSVMTDLFNKDMVKACSIPFDEKVYSKYLETMATCKLSLNGYSKQFMSKLQILGEMVYPRLNSKKSYEPSSNSGFGSNMMNNGNTFSNSTNSTLDKMKNRY